MGRHGTAWGHGDRTWMPAEVCGEAIPVFWARNTGDPGEYTPQTPQTPQTQREDRRQTPDLETLYTLD